MHSNNYKLPGYRAQDLNEIDGKVVKAPCKNMEEALAALSCFDPEDLESTLGVLIRRIEALESGQGATAYFHMVQGVGDDPG